MGLLNNLFSSPGKIAKRAKQDEDLILKNWNDYIETIEEKKHIIGKLPSIFGERKQNLKRLGELSNLELVDISLIEKEDSDVISDIKWLEHDKKIKHIQKLEITLGHFETRHKYTYELLRHLYLTINSEMILIKKLASVDLRAYRKLTENLKSEFNIEQSIINQIGEMHTFPKLLTDLVNGEIIIQRLNKKEKRGTYILSSDTNKDMDTLIDQWTWGVFEKIKDKVYEMVADGTLEEPYADFQFVNGSQFINLVREVVSELRNINPKRRVKAKPVSEETINAFVHIFRAKYNSEVE